jgi:lysophospholipase L1-like esterase
LPGSSPRTQPRRFERYVAIGDSSTEGLNDPDGNGGYRGWSRRLAARIADAQGGLLYANFGVRGLTTRQILDRQLEPAVCMRPDLVTMFSGTNDVIGRNFSADSVARDLEHMQRTFIENGATVLTFTLPDLTPVMPIARWIAPRIQALNDAVRAASESTGATLLDFASYAVATDARLWHEDRIHANATGHARIADALAFALRLSGTDDAWGIELPPLAPPTLGLKLAAEIKWMRRYLLPWIGKGMRARFKGKRRERRRPSLERVEPVA